MPPLHPPLFQDHKFSRRKTELPQSPVLTPKNALHLPPGNPLEQGRAGEDGLLTQDEGMGQLHRAGMLAGEGEWKFPSGESERDGWHSHHPSPQLTSHLFLSPHPLLF